MSRLWSRFCRSLARGRETRGAVCGAQLLQVGQPSRGKLCAVGGFIRRAAGLWRGPAILLKHKA